MDEIKQMTREASTLLAEKGPGSRKLARLADRLLAAIARKLAVYRLERLWGLSEAQPRSSKEQKMARRAA